MAEQAGYGSAPELYARGDWCADGDSDADEDYWPCHREAQLDRLEEHGREPSLQELSLLAWPHTEWWYDRDRIVLLHEHLTTSEPADGSFDWEKAVCNHVMALWSDGRTGTGTITGSDHHQDQSRVLADARMCWADFADDEAPGWRMLSSLPSCPNTHMR